MNVLAIIPARGGSKGVPGKNIAPLDGKPLLTYAIEAAVASRKTTRIVVSTDDANISKTAKQLNATVVERPGELATDEAPIVPVIMHAVETCKLLFNEEYDVVMLLQPTAPLRTGADIDNALNLIEQNENIDGVISVIQLSDIHPARMYRVEGTTHELIPMDVYGETARRQDLPPVYIRNGCIYATRTSILIHQNTVMPAKKQAYIMDEKWYLNIDNPRDLLIGNLIAKEWKIRTK